MKYITLKESIAEARKFVEIAELVIEENNREPACLFLYSSKNSGKCRRQSMELTRKLADLRQNR